MGGPVAAGQFTSGGNTYRPANGPYSPIIQVPQNEVDLMNRLRGNRTRQPVTPAQPTQPFANTVLAGREPTPTPATPATTSTTTAQPGGAFASILALLRQAAGG